MQKAGGEKKTKTGCEEKEREKNGEMT